MMLYGTPVAKMFQQGAPRLLKAGLNILPGHPNDNSRVALEVYPGLAARRFLGRTPYKNDDPRKQHAPSAKRVSGCSISPSQQLMACA